MAARKSGSDDASRASTSQLSDGDAGNDEPTLDGDGEGPADSDGDGQDEMPWVASLEAMENRNKEQFEKLLHAVSSAQGQSNKVEQLVQGFMLAQAGRNNGSSPQADALDDVDFEDPQAVKRMFTVLAKAQSDTSAAIQRQSQTTEAQTERQTWMAHFEPQLLDPADWPDIERELKGVPTAELATRFAEINKEKSKAAIVRAAAAAGEKPPEKPSGRKREGEHTYDGAFQGGKQGGAGKVQIVDVIKRHLGNTTALQKDPDYQRYVAGE